MKWGKKVLEKRDCNRLRTERESNGERQKRFVNLFPCLSVLSVHISVMTIHMEWLGKKWMIEMHIHEELREGVSPLLLLYSVVAIALQYNYNALITQNI